MNRPHKNLVLWKEAVVLCKITYAFCGNLPADEKFGMTSQIKRCVVSVPANIAEGAARSSQKEFNRFLHISGGSLSELDALIELCGELGMGNKKQSEMIQEQINKVSALLNGLIKKLKINIGAEL